MNKLLKALLAAVLTFGFLVSGAGTILAEGLANTVSLTFQGNNHKTQAILVNGVSYAPLHHIGDELGFSVAESYIDDSLVISRANKRVEMLNGRAWALVNGHEVMVPERLPDPCSHL